MRVNFNSRVRRAVYDKKASTEGCLEDASHSSLVDEDEIALRISEFQLINQNQKRVLHEHHKHRKRCRLHQRQDINDAFWDVFEDHAWYRLTELTDTVFPTLDLIQQFVHAAILYVDKNEILKLWREKCMMMMMMPIVEQHHMVPFHERWIQDQFKEENNIEKMKTRLSE